MNFLSIINLFERWLNGEPLSETASSCIYLTLVLCVLSIILLAMLICMAHLGQWGKRIKWFFEDICHWLGWNIGSYKEESEDEEQ